MQNLDVPSLALRLSTLIGLGEIVYDEYNERVTRLFKKRESWYYTTASGDSYELSDTITFMIYENGEEQILNRAS